MSNLIEQRFTSLSDLPSKIETVLNKQEAIFTTLEIKKAELAAAQNQGVLRLTNTANNLIVDSEAAEQARIAANILPQDIPNINNSINPELLEDVIKKTDSELRKSVAELNPRIASESKSVRAISEFSQSRGQNIRTFSTTLTIEELRGIVDFYMNLTGESLSSVTNTLTKGLGLLAPVNRDAPLYNPFDIDKVMEDRELNGYRAALLINNRMIGYINESTNSLQSILDLNQGINPINYALA